MPRVVATLAVASLIWAACGGGQRRDAKRSQLDTAGAVAELNYRLAVDPKDHSARRKLGMLQASAGNSGAALRHLLRAHRGDALRGKARAVLAGLLVKRAGARVGARELDAVADLALARRLNRSSKVAPAIRVAAHATASLALLRHADLARRRQGRVSVAALLKLSPKHPLAAVTDPGATAPMLARAVRWLAGRNARRLIVELGERYWKSGGRNHHVMRTYLRAHDWWYGNGTRPSLLMMNELARSGLRVCDIARSPDDYGCSLEMSTIVKSAQRSQRVLKRARQLFWSTAEPRPAAAWTVLSLRAWMFGSADSWLTELSRRVDLGKVRAHADRVPVYARATILRAAGARDASRTALDLALRSVAGMTKPARAVVLAEAAAQQRNRVVLKLLDAGEFDDLGWRVALVVARTLKRESAVLNKAPPAMAASYLSATGRLGPSVGFGSPTDKRAAHIRYARWWSSLAQLPALRDATVARWKRLYRGFNKPGASSPPLGSADLLVGGTRGSAVSRLDGPLTKIALAHARDPALADRLAGQFADGDIRLSGRGGAVASLFRRLGDARRAQNWRGLLVKAHPTSWTHLAAEAVSAAEAGKARFARQRFTSAAAWSGEPGAVRLLAARTFLRVGKPVDALLEARRALRHTAPGEEQPVLRVIIDASLALARLDDAARAAQRWLRRTPAAFRAAARGWLQRTWPRLKTRLAGPVRAPSLPETVRRWNPYGVRASALLVTSLRPSDGRFKPAVGELLASVMGRWQSRRAVPALVVAALVSAFERLHAPKLAATVRAEAKRVARLRRTY